jgi:subtilisin-like proprotein convertase family protein
MNNFVARIALAGTAIAGLAVAGSAPAIAATNTYTHTDDVGIGDMYAESIGGQIQILDGSMNGPSAALPYPSTAAQVRGLVGSVTSVAVAIYGFDHEAPRDVDLMLVAPNGNRSLVMSDVGGASPVSDVNLLFTDDATGSLNFDDKVTSGVYRPSNDSIGDYFPTPAPSVTGIPATFGAFEGINPNGFWELYAVDDLMTYTGGIDSWRLYVTTSGGDYPSTLEVGGLEGAITDLDVELTMDHNRFSDLDLMLVGPQGQQATLVSDVGGLSGISSGGTLVLDDSANAAVSDPVTHGRFRPTDLLDPASDDFYGYSAPAPDGNTLLSVFDGTDANGTWQLYAVDDLSNYSGYIYDWSLHITTADPVVPQPPVDTSHPRVESTRPEIRETGVARGASVLATVTERLRAESVKGATAYLVRKGGTRRVPATVSWRPETWRIVVDPTRRLRARTTYVVVVTTGVRDLAGNRLDQNRAKAGLQPMRWRFTTR